MADAAGIARGAVRDLTQTFRLLNLEQRIAAISALLLIASTFGPFSFVEAAQILTALGVLLLLHARAQGKVFHLPFGDGTAIAAAGAWAGLLIVVRLFDRPLGQNILALACAVILALAGASERAKRPPDDLPPELRPQRERRSAIEVDASATVVAVEPAVVTEAAAPAVVAADPPPRRRPASPPAPRPPVEGGEQLSLEDPVDDTEPTRRLTSDED
jgi:hypothetical protein